MTFGERLRTLRKELGIKQKDFAQALGVNSITYGGYERNLREPPLQMLTNLVNRYNIDVNWLLTGKNKAGE